MTFSMTKKRELLPNRKDKVGKKKRAGYREYTLDLSVISKNVNVESLMKLVGHSYFLFLTKKNFN